MCETCDKCVDCDGSGDDEDCVCDECVECEECEPFRYPGPRYWDSEKGVCKGAVSCIVLLRPCKGANSANTLDVKNLATDPVPLKDILGTYRWVWNEHQFVKSKL